MTKRTAVAVLSKTAIVNWNAALKASAQKTKAAAAVLGTISKYASFKGGTLVVGGASLNPMFIHCIVLATMNERAFYEGIYNPNEPRTPICFAYGEVDGELPVEPHEKSEKPQHETCEGCPNAEWGTAGEGKRGQACKQSFDLMFVQCSANPNAEEILKAKIFGARLPATSLKFAKAYMDYIGAQGSAVFAWRTLLEVKPGTPFTVHLSPQEEIAPSLQAAVMSRIAAARADIMAPYLPIEDTTLVAKPKARFGKK